MKSFRGTGRTSEQIINAPRGAIFIWCNGRMDYIGPLVRRLNRTDITVVPPSWLDHKKWRGLELKGVVVDHALDLSMERLRLLIEVESRVRP